MFKNINKENTKKVVNLVKKNKKEIIIGGLVVAANVAGVVVGVMLWNEFADQTPGNSEEVAGLIEGGETEEVETEQEAA